jgi:glycine/D-amino acid oxidase-like deaminating enzyme
VCDHADVVVLGAGLTGATAALAIAKAGVNVVLVDQDRQAMNRASLRNEGKIHLGFVFANDQTRATARLMVEGALSFHHILRQVAAGHAQHLRLSTPFVYLVAEDSLLSPSAIGEHYEAVEALYWEHARLHPELDYLGGRPRRIFRAMPRSALDRHFASDRIAAAFQTAELAIDTDHLARLIRRALAAEPRIQLRLGHRVESVQRNSGRFRVEGTSLHGPWQIEGGQVVNALWENRFKIDQTVGLRHPPGWLHRMKYRVIARLPAHLRNGPSATIVLGPYGDVVVRPDHTAFISWYPLGCRGWSDDLSPPESWNRPCRGELTTVEAQAISSDLLGAIDGWYPGIARSTPLQVDAGAIVAYGRTDVDDPASGLHDRTRVGVTSVDGYHSVDPGKLTTAPLFGVLAASKVLQAQTVAA